MAILNGFYKSVTKHIDEVYAGVIYMNVKKAFDNDPLRKLVQNLRAHGTEDKLINWI